MSSKYDRPTRSDRHQGRHRKRSPSYSSYDSESSYTDSEYESSPPRRRAGSPGPAPPSRRKTTAVGSTSSRHHHDKSRAAYSDSENRDRRGRDARRKYYEEEDEDESPTRRNVVEDLLAAVGLIHAKNGDDNHRRDRSRRDSRDDDREYSNEEKKGKQRQALQAALTAAAVEAYRTRKEGGLTAQRLMRIAGAAIAAGGLDAIVDRNPNSGGLKHIVESIVAGLATSNTVGKSVKHRPPGSIKDKVGTGLVGSMAKKILSRSLSRGPERRRSRRD